MHVHVVHVHVWDLMDQQTLLQHYFCQCIDQCPDQHLVKCPHQRSWTLYQCLYRLETNAQTSAQTSAQTLEHGGGTPATRVIGPLLRLSHHNFIINHLGQHITSGGLCTEMGTIVQPTWLVHAVHVTYVYYTLSPC